MSLQALQAWGQQLLCSPKPAVDYPAGTKVGLAWLPSGPAQEGSSSCALTPGPSSLWRDLEEEEGKPLAYTLELFPSHSPFLD